jgi:PAS domain S-box-containing protein
MPTSLPPRVRGYLGPALADSVVWSAMLDAPVPALVCDQGGTLLLANQAMLDLLARPLELLLGHGWIPLLCASGDDLSEVLASPGTVRHRKDVDMPGGEVHTLEMTCSAVRLPDGARGVVALAAIAARVRAASGRQGIDRGYRELVEDAPDLMVRFDSSGQVLFVNRAIERFIGATAEEVTTDPSLFVRTIAREYRAVWDAAFAQVQHGDARAFDLVLKHKDGRQVIVYQSLYPIRDAQGGVRFLESTARDVTAVRQIEALKLRNEERTSLDRLKSQLLANVSHELRTPLVSIKGYNDLLLRGALGPLTAKQKRGLEIAAANTDRLIELIETLLDFQRREEGRLELRATRVDVRMAVEDAAAALAERIASRHLTLDVDLGNEPLFVLGDRHRLAQVFRALLGNAEKFSDGASGQIRVFALADGEWVTIAVADRGIGIPREAHERIFDRFYQVDASSTRRFGGAGLGLALAKELITLHGGNILVQSAEGEGSTFSVRLPRAVRDRTATPVEGAARPVVLVGADAAGFQKLRRVLEDGDPPPSLLVAHEAEELVKRARRHRPDLVVVALPDPEATVAAVKTDPDAGGLPVVAVTDDGLPVAFADFTVKAGEPARLGPAIQRLLGRRPAGLRAQRVVIVEDELEILDFTRFVLEREGYDVVCVSEGEQTLVTVDRDCDLVILDIALEGSDGIEVCRQLRSSPDTRDVPVLIMTAMSGDEVRSLALRAGANGYLVKPFGLDEFLRQVQLHVRPAATQTA